MRTGDGSGYSAVVLCSLDRRSGGDSRLTAQDRVPPPEPNENGVSLRRKVDDLLRQELTQHWYPHAVDRRRGGFHQSMARDWSLKPDENAFLVYQARMTWTAAAFAEYSPSSSR